MNKRRQAFLMSRMGKTSKEIADALGTDATTANRWIQRARRAEEREAQKKSKGRKR